MPKKCTFEFVLWTTMAQGKSRLIIDPWRPVRWSVCLHVLRMHIFLYITEYRVLITLCIDVLYVHAKKSIYVTISLAWAWFCFMSMCMCVFFFSLSLYLSPSPLNSNDVPKQCPANKAERTNEQEKKFGIRWGAQIKSEFIFMCTWNASHSKTVSA